jgi:hypothetical protein
LASSVKVAHSAVNGVSSGASPEMPANSGETVTEELTTRNADGTFPAGVSGNPLGRPKGKKNELTEHKQDLELAVRKAVKPARIIAIVEKIVAMAEEGNLRAAKLILDKVISNAKDVDDVDNKGVGGITIRIENATFAAKREQNNSPPVEGEFIEVSK